MEAVKLAQEIKGRAMQIDEQSIDHHSTITKASSQEEIQEGFEELNGLIKMLGLKYGTTIRIEKNEKSNL